MKKKGIVVVFIFILFVAAALLSMSSIAKTTRNLKIDLKFGLKMDRCQGFGVCLIYIPGDGFSAEYSQLSFVDGTVYIEVPFLKAKELESGFDTDTFIMDEEYQIPAEVVRELGLDIDLILPKGKHQIKQTGEGYRIEFKVR